MRVVHGKTMGYACAAIMGNDVEALEPKPMHQCNLITCHRALGIGNMFRIAGWLGRVAVSTQIGGDNGVPLRKRWRYAVPDGVGLRKPMQ